MGQVESRTHSTGIETYHASGTLTREDVEAWHTRIIQLVADGAERGACGALIDISRVEGLSVAALDALIEQLAGADELLAKTRLRVALIGVSPHTECLLREALTRSTVKNLQGRFFHTTAEQEALAWLQVVIDTAAAPPAQAATPAPPAEKPAPKRKRRLFGRAKRSAASHKADRTAQRSIKDRLKPA
jgi:hypothetical protein